jgi:hypothetical protein
VTPDAPENPPDAPFGWTPETPCARCLWCGTTACALPGVPPEHRAWKDCFAAKAYLLDTGT